MADVMQQLRAEVNESISGRMDMLNSINTAPQKQYRISDFLPRNWERRQRKGEIRSLMSDLHLWMQTWSNQGEKMLVSVQSTDRFDSSTLAVHCPDDEFRSIEATLHQVLHRTTAHEPLGIVQQTSGQKGSEAWHSIVRRCDQRNMSDTNAGYAALTSNISERDRAKDVEQVDDILKTFTNEMNKFDNRFGKIRDEEKNLAVKELMLESLLNFWFRGTTMSYCELLSALENIIDKVSTFPTAGNRKTDTSAPTETGMAAKDDGESAREARDQRIVDFALQAVHEGTGKGQWVFWKGSELERKRWQRWRRKLVKRHC